MIDYRIDTFLCVAEAGSFAAAGRKLHMSHAGVLKQIRELENQIQVELFSRSPRGVRLTKSGEIYWEAASKISRLSKEAEEKIREIAQAE